jgi:hypothetical protein
MCCSPGHRAGARVAKLVDAPGLGPDASNGVGVRVPPRAPHTETDFIAAGEVIRRPPHFGEHHDRDR